MSRRLHGKRPTLDWSRGQLGSFYNVNVRRYRVCFNRLWINVIWSPVYDPNQTRLNKGSQSTGVPSGEQDAP